MKKIFYTFLLISPLLFISSCEEEEETQSGYNCVSNTCSAVFENPQYLTLEDCQSACGENNNSGGTNIEIGAMFQGGVIFYIDETGEHGLVAAVEDLEEIYEWGCYMENVDGADGTSIGTGYQNTMDIVNQGCTTEEGGITAAQATLDAQINGYSDWYLPSLDELIAIYNAFPEGSMGAFDTSEYSPYWSSSQHNYNNAWFINNNGITENDIKFIGKKVRLIRSF